MEHFTQLTYHERAKIYSGLCTGKSKNSIAQELGRAKSTIYREIYRNSDRIGYLYPGIAHENAQKRKNRNEPKISRNQKLKSYIIAKLKKRWSPNVIAGRYKLENPGKGISAETIYQWIYSGEGEDLKLKKLLVRAHKKRGFKRKTKRSSIKNRVSIHARPEHINNRSEIGHWECDLIFNRGSQSKNICTLTDRLTRKSILIKNESKHSKTVIDAITLHLVKRRADFKSITFDNGSEFADHTKLNKLGSSTYFCDPGCPWQKGSIEHLNGMIRRFLPFNLSTNDITNQLVKSVTRKMNNMPRAILGFMTPLEFQRGRESRVKLAQPATEANVNVKQSGVAFRY